MASPFRRKDIAKAFFDLDISDTESSSYLSAKTTNKGKQKLTLLALPAEIRIQIYDYVLVGRVDRESNWPLVVGKTCQKKGRLDWIRTRQDRAMEPAILRTCRQVYHEAIPVLHTQNVFSISKPESMLALMAQIRPVHIKLLRTLEIWIPWTAEDLPWVTLLHTLAVKATGLRFIELGWGAEYEYPWEPRKKGLGDNMLVVHALATIKQLEKLKITGYFAKHWPAYLGEEMGVQVQFECGHPVEPDEDDSEKSREWQRKLNEENPQHFRAYQEGTENLIP